MGKYKNLSKNNNNYSIHGLDIGNATLVNDKGLVLDAKITTIEPLKEADRIVIGDSTYWLGYGAYDTTYEKINKKHYLDMLYGLLALSTTTTNNYVGLGLPLSQYKAHKDKLIDLVMMNNKKIVTLNQEVERAIIIEDVEVFPEGVCTLRDNEECIIIDLGGGTTDCGLATIEHGKRKIINPITVPKGTIKLYDEYANKLINKGLDVTLEDAERILNRGYLYKQGSDDIQYDEYDEFIETIVNKLQLNYNLKIYPITITGGGGELLYNKLKSRLADSDLFLQHEPIKANARNFYELACTVFTE